MINEFISDIKRLYDSVIKGDFPSLMEFKSKWEVKKSIGEEYQRLCKKSDKKETGSFYTPYEVVDFMVTELVTKIDYKRNPYLKILDPSCGGGYFLIDLVKRLGSLAGELGIEEPYKHVLENNIYGFDIDENAVMISVIELYDRTGYSAKNVSIRDFLLEDQGEYDCVIGNPPYMGHKVIKKDYREALGEMYGDVFRDKGDLSYCFIKKSIDVLSEGGRLTFFTSRYILEALNGENIRDYIVREGSIERLLDFYGVRVVKGAGVDTIIMEFIKEKEDRNMEFYRLRENAKGMGKSVFEDVKNGDEVFTRKICLDKKKLNSWGWTFLSDEEEGIIEKLQGVMLKEICTSHQGIITGCDKAFVISKDDAECLGVEKKLLVNWIKGSNIHQFDVDKGRDFLIYSDFIEDERLFPNAMEWISRYIERLEGRRECLKGLRPWYHLQWGRDSSIFINKKIIFPYKASKNRFAIDEGSFFSADVYAIKIKEQFTGHYSYEFLTGILNSRIYEFYIKTIAKKLGDNLYEYYPNKIMNIRVPDFIEEIEKLVEKKPVDLRDRIDEVLKSHFGITEYEYSIITTWCQD